MRDHHHKSDAPMHAEPSRGHAQPRHLSPSANTSGDLDPTDHFIPGVSKEWDNKNISEGMGFQGMKAGGAPDFNYTTPLTNKSKRDEETD